MTYSERQREFTFAKNGGKTQRTSRLSSGGLINVAKYHTITTDELTLSITIFLNNADQKCWANSLDNSDSNSKCFFAVKVVDASNYLCTFNSD